MDKPKRGRPPKAAEDRAGAVIHFRVRGNYREELEKAAKLANRSLSEECEARLNRSVQREAALAEMFGSPDQQELLLAIGSAVRHADGLSDGPGHDNVLQGYAAAIAIVQGLAKTRAAEILNRASDTGHGWRDAAAGVLALERRIDEPTAVLLVDPRSPQLPPRTRAVLKKELAEIAEKGNLPWRRSLLRR